MSIWEVVRARVKCVNLGSGQSKGKVCQFGKWSEQG